ncbi:hypothetical protein SUGI_1030710 [Cryptomeria japonica]|nr:hypothetical protein SUGI_1030710 [Cryptomeria japonica]
MRMHFISSSVFLALCIFFNAVSGQVCDKHSISAVQGPGSPLSNVTPTWSVHIVNACSTGCSIAKIHLSCGWFSSGVTINPRLFKRLAYNDCLVKNGDPIKAGGSISFVYAQTYKYPMEVSSVTCV